MSITREEIRQLCIAHDRFMAEQASESIQLSSISETDAAGLLYRHCDNNALASPPQPDGEPSNETLGLFGDERDQLLAESLGYVIAELRREWRAERDQALALRDASIATLEKEAAQLRGRVDVLVKLLAGHLFAEDVPKSGEIVDLPDWRKRHA